MAVEVAEQVRDSCGLLSHISSCRRFIQEKKKGRERGELAAANFCSASEQRSKRCDFGNKWALIVSGQSNRKRCGLSEDGVPVLEGRLLLVTLQGGQ